MRSLRVVLAVVGFTLAACGEPEPSGGAVPPASPAGSSIAPVPTTEAVPGTGEPYDPAARLRPDLMMITPEQVAPGGEVELTYPEQSERGVAFVLERAVGETWSTTHLLSSSTAGYGGQPSSVSVDAAEGYGWEDIGIAGPGPDLLVLPRDASIGASRICTANALENFCAEIDVITAIPDTTTPDTTTPDTTERVPIVAVHEDVEYYIACADVPVTVDGIRWYPVAEWGNEQTAELFDEITSVDRQPPGAQVGFAPRVAPPGPGDDVGTIYVYADEVAWFESDSGQTIWLTQDEITYTWVC